MPRMLGKQKPWSLLVFGVISALIIVIVVLVATQAIGG